MAEIRLSSATLRARRNTLYSYMRALRNLRDQFTQRVNSLGSCWEGEAKTTYVNACNKIIVKIDTFINGIMKYIEALDRIIAEYERAEAKNISTAKY